MLDRYALPEMKALWSEERKFQTWLDVELAVFEARAHLKLIPVAAHESVKAHATFDVARIAELEREYDHDMLAFIGSVQEALDAAGAGEYMQYFHQGLTSYDVEDTATAVRLCRAGELILEKLRRLCTALVRKAHEYKWTLMIARTHGQYAEPDTFGRLLLVYAYAIKRGIARIERAIEDELRFGKISGAVGTYAGLVPLVEPWACATVDLKRAEVSTQILQRDRHAAFLAALSVTAGTIEQMARTFWEMMRSDVGELEEPERTKGQRGSSAMAHKKNPRITEQLQGLARRVRGMAQEAMENIATPEGRDISQSSVERHIFPDATALMHYMAHNATWLVENLVVHAQRMADHLQVDSWGVWASQPLRLALMRAGVSYDEAYAVMQETAYAARMMKKHMRRFLTRREVGGQSPRTVLAILGRKQLEECFDARAYIRDGIEEIFSRFPLSNRGSA